MSFDADITNGLDDLFTFFGKDAILNVGGLDVSCHVDVIYGVDLQPGGFTAQVSGDSTVIEFTLSEIITEPERGDTVTVGSSFYTIESIAENDGYTVKAIVRES
jgi:hypothetical protein